MRKETLALVGKTVGLVAIALVVMLIVHFIGGQSILPWASFFATILLGIPSLLGTGSTLDLSLDFTRTVESNQKNPAISPPRMKSFDWSDDAQENLREVNSNPEWRRAEDSGYDSWRKIGSSLHTISNQVQSLPHVTERRIRASLIFLVLFGCSWFLIILVELMASGGLSPIGFVTIAEISPLNYTIGDFPVFQLAISLMLFLIPVGYLDWKTGTSCDECGSMFSLGSRGRYWHPDLKEEKTKDGTKVTVYHGVRFRECEDCGTLLQDTNYSWEDSI